MVTGVRLVKAADYLSVVNEPAKPATAPKTRARITLVGINDEFGVLAPLGRRPGFVAASDDRRPAGSRATNVVRSYSRRKAR